MSKADVVNSKTRKQCNFVFKRKIKIEFLNDFIYRFFFMFFFSNFINFCCFVIFFIWRHSHHDFDVCLRRLNANDENCNWKEKYLSLQSNNQKIRSHNRRIWFVLRRCARRKNESRLSLFVYRVCIFHSSRDFHDSNRFTFFVFTLQRVD